MLMDASFFRMDTRILQVGTLIGMLTGGVVRCLSVGYFDGYFNSRGVNIRHRVSTVMRTWIPAVRTLIVRRNQRQLSQHDVCGLR